MADKRITLFELHLHEGRIQIGPETIGDAIGEATDLEADEAAENDPDSERSGVCPGRIVALLAGVLLVVAVAVLGAKYLGEDPDPALDELDEAGS